MRGLPFFKPKKGAQFAGLGFSDGSGGGGSYVLPIASADTLGGVKVGDGLSINEAGVLSASGGGGGGIDIETNEHEVGTLNNATIYQRIFTVPSLYGTLSTSLIEIGELPSSQLLLAFGYNEGDDYITASSPVEVFKRKNSNSLYARKVVDDASYENQPKINRVVVYYLKIS